VPVAGSSSPRNRSSVSRYAQVRTALEDELRDVLATNEWIGNHLRNADRTLPQDSRELAWFLNNDEVLESLEARTRERIDDLCEAIARIDEGICDRCALCAAVIEAGRLEVLPTTRICSARAERVA